MDMLAALALQLEWGADEALDLRAVDRRGLVAAAAVPATSAALAPAPAAARGRVAAVPPGVGETAAARARAAAAAADSPAALRSALAGFDAFGLAATATSLVFADGEAQAGLVIVGDAPGAEEDASGIAFSGPAGRLLDRMLGSIGLDRRVVLLTTVVPWRPPGGRPPSEAEIACCLPFLERHLALLRPRRLVTLGALPARALLGRREPVSRLRGRWMDAAIHGLPDAVPTLPMLHPSQLLARPEWKALAWSDLRLLHRTLSAITDS